MTHRLHPRLFSLLALPALIAACRDVRAPLAPALGGPQFSQAPGAGQDGAIAFHSNRDGDFDIYVMNADGSDVTPVTDNTVHEFDPIWSPNGKQIAFGRLSGAGADVVVINADGSEERVLTANGFPGAWSPDGRQIAFGRDGGIWVVNVDGSGLAQLSNDGFPTGWSPNGKQIAFNSFRDGDLDIYVMNVDGSGVIQLTNDPETDFGDRAGWSPNGKVFLFSSWRDGDIEVFVMNAADGSGVTKLTDNFCNDDDAVWSPNGKQIAFHSTCDGDEEIVVINADGSGATQITHNTALPDGTPIFDAVPAWRARPLP